MDSLASVYGPRVSRRRLLQGAVVVAVVGIASWPHVSRAVVMVVERPLFVVFVVLALLVYSSLLAVAVWLVMR